MPHDARHSFARPRLEQLFHDHPQNPHGADERETRPMQRTHGIQNAREKCAHENGANRGFQSRTSHEHARPLSWLAGTEMRAVLEALAVADRLQGSDRHLMMPVIDARPRGIKIQPSSW
jgi:hypothetical protein